LGLPVSRAAALGRQMKTIDRRDFLKMAGAGSAVVVAGVAMPVAGYFGWINKDILRFRAVAGMPTAPLPSYASYVIGGQVELRARRAHRSRTKLGQVRKGWRATRGKKR